MNSELDIHTLNVIFTKYQQQFIRFAISYVNDSAVAEDIVMESLEASWKRISSLTEDTLPAYMMTTIKNRCLNHLRSKYIKIKAAQQISSHSAEILAIKISTLQACDPNELFESEARRLVDEALAKLPLKSREIFVRSRLEKESHKQIAEQMGITVKNVEFEISKVVKIMRVVLKDYLILFIMLRII